VSTPPTTGRDHAIPHLDGQPGTHPPTVRVTAPPGQRRPAPASVRATLAHAAQSKPVHDERHERASTAGCPAAEHRQVNRGEMMRNVALVSPTAGEDGARLRDRGSVLHGKQDRSCGEARGDRRLQAASCHASASGKNLRYEVTRAATVASSSQ
jgi:hypothetical protein